MPHNVQQKLNLQIVAAVDAQAQDVVARLKALYDQEGNESWSEIRDEMGTVMEEGCGIYRDQESMQKAVDKIAELKERYKTYSCCRPFKRIQYRCALHCRIRLHP